jgi:phosphoglycolate phosphatase
MIKKSPEIFIFDLDGTLIDSVGVISQILNDMRSGFFLEPINKFEYKPWISLGARELIVKSLGCPEDQIEVNLNEFRRRYQLTRTPKAAIYPGVIETLSALASKGKTIALCSNKPEALCRKVIFEIGCANLFKIIVGGDSIKKTKPNPEPLYYILKLLSGSAKSSIFIGDSNIDLEASRAASIPFVFYSSGYDDGVNSSKAHYTIEKIPDLLKINFN